MRKNKVRKPVIKIKDNEIVAFENMDNIDVSHWFGSDCIKSAYFLIPKDGRFNSVKFESIDD